MVGITLGIHGPSQTPGAVRGRPTRPYPPRSLSCQPDSVCYPFLGFRVLLALPSVFSRPLKKHVYTLPLTLIFDEKLKIQYIAEILPLGSGERQGIDLGALGVTPGVGEVRESQGHPGRFHWRSQPPGAVFRYRVLIFVKNQGRR